ncbi:hypothetical protein ABFS83_08G099300 [Erythranthe nasuta]
MSLCAIKSIIFILFAFIISTTLLKIKAEKSNCLICEVCKKSRNPKLCLQILNSNRKVRNASSPPELWKISMNLTKSSAQSTKNTIAMLSLRTCDRAKKEQYKSCDMNYKSAIYYLNTANSEMKDNDFAKVGRYIASALNEPIRCRQSFTMRPYLSEPSDLKEGNDKLECLCSVLLVISNYLSKKNNFLFLSNM